MRGPADRQPRGFRCLTLQAVVKPSPGADVHTHPPVKTFDYSQSARGAEVAENCPAVDAKCMVTWVYETGYPFQGLPIERVLVFAHLC